MPRFAILGPGILSGATIAALLACSSPAAARPSVSLSLPDADAGARIAYSYASGHVPSRAKLVVQRQVGTARQFKTVATLAHAASGSGTLPPLGLGSYRLRIAVVERQGAGRRRHQALLAQQQKTLLVFATLPFKVLFRDNESTYATPTRSFSYVFQRIFVRDPETVVTVGSAANTCRSVHVDWVAGGSDTNDRSETGSASLIQESRDAVTGSAGWNVVSALDGVVTPGQSWGINVASLGANDLDFYVNGSASCYSRSLV